MKITLKEIRFKNLMTVGNVEQCIKLNDNFLTLIVGRNKDINVEGSTNGTGKSTAVQAIVYSIFGETLTDDIKKDRLVNFANKKNLEISLFFEKDGVQYQIDRGRKPTYLRLYISGNEYIEQTDETLGATKNTQQVIDDIFGISYELFRHICVLDTFNRPFLSLKDKDQRPLIEELLGITLLSKKADNIKDELKNVKSFIKTEEGKISSQISNNERIEKNIENIEFKKIVWDKDKINILSNIKKRLEEFSNIDIDEELKNHETNLKINEVEKKINEIYNFIKSIKSLVETGSEKIREKQGSITRARSHKCPECEQEIHNEVFDKIIENLEKELKELTDSKAENLSDLELLEDEFIRLSDVLVDLGAPPKLIYADIKDVYNHKNNLDKLEFEYNIELNKENPYEIQIQNLKETSIVEIDYSTINDLMSTKEHMDFLIKLLTSNESFIRKKIIEQNIKLLNKKLALYLDKMMLPHIINFNSDLTITIIKNGNEYDVGLLSKGEKNRVMLAVAWAMRDAWESLNGYINLWIFDEVIDTGMDPQGISSAIELLNSFVGDMKKDIFLISHKTDLIANIEHVLYAIKENDFTTYEYTE